MPRIFMSYRRSDAPDAAGRILDRLRHRFGQDSVFFDIDSVLPGVDIRAHIDQQVSQCDILIAIIGDGWLDPDESGYPRIFKETDFVRIEIESALSRGIPVIPVPVANAGIPEESALPEALRDLHYRNAMEVRSGTAFEGHIDRLLSGINKLAQTQLTTDAEILTSARLEPDRSSLVAPHELSTPRMGAASAVLLYSLLACFVHLVQPIAAESEFLHAHHVDYWALPLVGWIALVSGPAIYLAIATGVAVTVGLIAILVYSDAFDSVIFLGLFFLDSLAIAWYALNHSRVTYKLENDEIDLVAVAAAVVLLGAGIYYLHDHLGLEAYLGFDHTLFLSCFVVGMSRHKSWVLTLAAIVCVLTGLTFAIESLSEFPSLELAGGNLELDSHYAPAVLWHILLAIVLGWALKAKLTGERSALDWLASPWGLTLVILAGLVDIHSEFLGFGVQVRGSLIISYLAVLVFGYLDTRKAQYYTAAIALGSTLVYYSGELISLTQASDSAEYRAPETVVVTQMARSELWNALDVWMLPLLAWVGGKVRYAARGE